MKKIVLALLTLTAIFPAQRASALTDVQLQSQQDSLSMAIGKIYAAGVSKMYEQNPKSSKADFIESFELLMTADTTRKSYMEGFEVALNLYNQMKQMKSQSGILLNRDMILSQFKKSLYEPILEDQAMNSLNSDIQRHMATLEQEALTRISTPNQEAGARYMAQLLKSDKKYKKTASGLVYKMLKAGTGPNFPDTASVLLTYVGKHVNGTVFDQSTDTIAMQLNRVVAGFKEALTLMNAGSSMIAVMPSSIAYGDKGAGKDRKTGKYAIEPGETLIFEINAVALDGDKAAVSPAPQAMPKGKSGVRAKDPNYKGHATLKKGLKK